MKAHYLEVKNVIGFIVTGTLIVYGINLFLIDKASIKDIFDLIQTSYPILILSGLYYYFENYGWHHKFWKLFYINTILKFPPDMRGRWEGTLSRQDDREHHFVFEIQQKLSSVLITTYSPNGNTSSSVIEEITCDINQGDNFSLCFLWDGTGSKLPGESVRIGRFHGYSIMKYIEDNDGKRLVGNYFTDRLTKGTIALSFVGMKLKKMY
ncbi:MAG: hypothetical protein EOO43_19460 [Flavobacterium sp.]|nr:MAG: hypothetical protein EOO43_19460 [Flavobacterium sp.]